jgi:V8-like Glu-specific endopeptidase
LYAARGAHAAPMIRPFTAIAAALLAAVPAAAAGAPGDVPAQASKRIRSGYAKPPLAPVVHIRLSEHGYCSGTLITRALVLTAAHCLYANRTDGRGFVGWYGETGPLTVTPGSTVDSRGRRRRPYGAFRVRASVVPVRWQREDGGQDWALAVVGRDRRGVLPGTLTGTYSVHANVQIRPGNRFFSVGYPAAGPFSVNPYGQWFCETTWDGEEARSLAYTASSRGYWIGPCEMNGGSSGGPVFIRGQGDRWGIVGVNNRGVARSDGFGAWNLFYTFDDDFTRFYRHARRAIRAGERRGGADIELHR